jgi:hypothetical protein
MENKKSKLSIFLIILLIGICLLIGFRVFATTNIDSTNHWAWNDLIGWIDFYNTGNVFLSDSTLTGYASSSIGYISFDCASAPTPPGDCGSYPDWQVTKDEGGNFSGWAWNDEIGWISFDCHDTADNCISSIYQAKLVGQEFTNWAWNDVIGWISFNCSNSNTCSNNDYKVEASSFSMVTGSLTSSTFDTGVANGVAYNTLVYQGTKPSYTQVKFQFASSDSAEGPWNFSGYDNTDTTYYIPTSPNIPVALNSIHYNNKRYFRYKVFLYSNSARTGTPTVNDVVITWSQ